MLLELYCIPEFIIEPMFFNLIFYENDVLYLHTKFQQHCCTNFLHKYFILFFEDCGV